MSDLLSASFQIISGHATQLWNGPHTTSWHSVFKCRGRKRNLKLTPPTRQLLAWISLCYYTCNQWRQGCLWASPPLSCLLQVKCFFLALSSSSLTLYLLNTQIFVVFYFFFHLVLSLRPRLHSLLRSGDSAKDSWAFQPSLLASTSRNSQEAKLSLSLKNSRANPLTPRLPTAKCEREISTTGRCSADQSQRSEDISVADVDFQLYFTISRQFFMLMD